MKFQVGKCYSVTLHGKTTKFRVIRNENRFITVRHCGTGVEESLMDILRGDVSHIEVFEFDCMECDGKESVPSI